MSGAPAAPALTPEEMSANRGPGLIALYAVMAAIASVIVALRVVSRLSIRQLGWDDHTMVFTLVMFWGLAAFSIAMAASDGCKHMAAIAPDDLVQALKFNWGAQAFAIFGYATGKVSVGLLILRIIGPNTVVRKWIIYVLLALSMIFSIVDIIITFAQCNPPEALWKPFLVAQGKATCWDPTIQSDFALFLGCWNVAVDAVLAILPITIFYNLKISFIQKISCTCLLGLGLLAAVFGSIKAATLSTLSARSDLTWETFGLFAWSGAELFVLITCGSVPPLKPLFDRIFHPERMNRTRGYTAHSYGNDNTRRGFGPKPSKYGPDDSMNSTHDDRRALRDDEFEIGRYAPSKSPAGSGTGIVRTTEVSVTHHAI